MNTAAKSAIAAFVAAVALAALLIVTPTPRTVVAKGPPGTVSSVTLTRGDGTITATWDAVNGATKYHVTYTTDGGSSWHAPVTDNANYPTNSMTFNVDNAKTYMVGVRAGNDSGWSGWRNSSAIGPYTPPPTSTPTPMPTPTPTPVWLPAPLPTATPTPHSHADADCYIYGDGYTYRDACQVGSDG